MQTPRLMRYGRQSGRKRKTRALLEMRFQRIKYTVRADSWNSLEPDNVVEERFGPTGNASFIGTEEDPTMLNFELTRSRFRDITGTTLWEGCRHEQAVPVWSAARQADEEAGRIEHGDKSGRHYVAFSFSVSANVFSRQYSDRVEATAQVSTLFTLLLSAFFRFMKTQVENLHRHRDPVLGRKEKRFPVPKDVQHRIRVLEEQLVDPPDITTTGIGQEGGATAVASAAERSAQIAEEAKRAGYRCCCRMKLTWPAVGGDIEMVSVPNPMTRLRDLLDVSDTGGRETRTNETVKRLQREVRLLNVKLAQQQGRWLSSSNNNNSGTANGTTNGTTTTTNGATTTTNCSSRGKMQTNIKQKHET